MERYRVLIVEDEDDAAAQLRGCLERYAGEHGVALDAVRLRTTLELDTTGVAPDLVLMDIETPGGNGMDAAAELRAAGSDVPLVFVTNLAQYAVRGYAVDALDFLVKPYSYYDFSLRMDRALKVMRRDMGRRLTLRARGGTRVVRAADVAFVDVSGHDVVYHLASGEQVRERTSLSKASETLGGEPFLRVSSGCVVNMGQVVGLDGDAVTLATGDVAWISRSRRRASREALARYLGSL